MQRDIQIRSYDDSHRPDVVKLWQKVFPNPKPWNNPDSVISRRNHQQPELFLVASVERQVVGTAMGGYDGNRAWVYFVAVDPNHRREGIATTLMERLEVLFLQMGAPKINLQVRSNDQGVVAFYESLGFQVEDRVSLGKRLA